MNGNSGNINMIIKLEKDMAMTIYDGANARAPAIAVAQPW
jgi:hypothetical protein